MSTEPEVIVSPLADAVEALRQARMVRDAQADVVAARKAAIAKVLADDVATLKQLEQAADDAETVAHNAAWLAYQADPERRASLLPGVTVKTFKVPVYDPYEAFAWAEKKDMFVTRPQLMRKEFESFALSPAAQGSSVPVQITTEARVQFAKVLPGSPLPVAPVDPDAFPWDTTSLMRTASAVLLPSHLADII